MIRFSFLILTFSLLLTACQNATTSNATESSQTAPQEQAQANAAAPAAQQYPSIAEDRMKVLWDSCDYVDFVFYSTNFSMSQNQGPAIRNTLQGISTEVPTIKSSCQAAGRIFFMIDGVNVEEADIYLGPDCFYYIWLDEGQYAYANLMTDQGVKFYQNIFAQVQATGGQ